MRWGFAGVNFWVARLRIWACGSDASGLLFCLDLMISCGVGIIYFFGCLCLIDCVGVSGLCCVVEFVG